MWSKGKSACLGALVYAALAFAPAAAAQETSSSSRLGRLLSGPSARRPERPELQALDQRIAQLAAHPGAEVATDAIETGRRALARARAALAAGDRAHVKRAAQLARAALDLASRRIAAQCALRGREAAARRVKAAESRAAEAVGALHDARLLYAALRAKAP